MCVCVCVCCMTRSTLKFPYLEGGNLMYSRMKRDALNIAPSIFRVSLKIAHVNVIFRSK